MPNDTIVDIYCHIFPDAFFQEMNRIAPRLGNIAARLRSVKKLFDLDARFREMDQFGDYREIISLPNPPIEDFAGGEVGLNLARIGNDAMAELCARHPARFAMWWCFGWPYDTSVAMVRLALWGLLDRYPRLKIVTHHLGGMIPYYDGRIGPGLEVLGSRTSDEDYSRILPSLKRPHLDYMRDFYGDTALFGGGIHAVRCGLEFFGAEHVVFATDTPLGPIAPTIEVIKRLEIADADRRKIFAGNAERLLKRKLS